ncbi:sensor histidine kinase [Paenibacillus thermotolerans]|uniref:sensor histidine kinase n=1 Tax=Paenibacillus thermotolerans TaxID=3027807 RepID=UPI0023680B44|nr:MULTISPECIES: sensor histidine kinase [unclassified Paenibacillus]
MEQTNTNFQETIRQIGKRVELQNEQFTENVEAIRNNQVIKNNLKDLKAQKLNYNVAKYRISNQVLRSPNLDTMDNIIIFPVNRPPMNIFYSVPMFQMDAAAGKLMTDFSRHNSEETVWLAQSEPFQVSVISFIHDNGELLGLLRIDVNEVFYKQLDEVKLGESGTVYLVKDQMIAFAQDREWVSKNEASLYQMNGSKLEYELEGGSWKLIGVIPQNETVNKVNQVNRIFLFMELLIFIAILAFVTATARIILKPMKKLMKGMEHIQNGKLDVIIGNHGDDEFSVIIHHFNSMVERVNTLIKTVYYQQLHYRKSEIVNLQSKLDPHFLYNTLDMIYWMSVMKDEEEIGEAILALSNILRYSISHKNEFVSVREDMNQLENYLKIQSMRFEDKLEYRFEIEKDVLDVKIPKLLIQPLVENAIKYAFKNMKIGGTICIKGYSDQDDLWFQVIDNGTGIPEEKVRSLYEDSHSKGEETGIGIRLVHQRIRYIFGENYGVSIESEVGQGTKVSVRLNKNTNFLTEDYTVQWKEETEGLSARSRKEIVMEG